ncbi:MAG: hypothetical protein JWM09_560 [Francisellaceae bacterium]|nr:hypothetical protein [Francisellaceae bacterium]
MSKSAEDIEKELFEKKIDKFFASDPDKEEMKRILTEEVLSANEKALFLKLVDLSDTLDPLIEEGLKTLRSTDEAYKTGIPTPGGGLSISLLKLQEMCNGMKKQREILEACAKTLKEIENVNSQLGSNFESDSESDSDEEEKESAKNADLKPKQ